MHLTFFARPDRADERELIPTVKVHLTVKAHPTVSSELPFRIAPQTL